MINKNKLTVNGEMSNHEKTTVVGKLFGNYSFIENVLANLGMESLVVHARAQKLGEGVKVTPANDANAEDFPLSTLDYE